MSDPSWVLRRAKQRRVCSSCDGWILIGELYFRALSGEFWCCQCPPVGAEDMDVCDYD